MLMGRQRDPTMSFHLRRVKGVTECRVDCKSDLVGREFARELGIHGGRVLM